MIILIIVIIVIAFVFFLAMFGGGALAALQSRNRKWTKDRAKMIITQGHISDEKEYWLVRDNLNNMKDADTEAGYLLKQIESLKP